MSPLSNGGRNNANGELYRTAITANTIQVAAITIIKIGVINGANKDTTFLIIKVILFLTMLPTSLKRLSFCSSFGFSLSIKNFIILLLC